MKRRIMLLAVMLLVSAVPTAFAVAPPEARELTLRITQSGEIHIQEPVAAANIVIAIPQNTQDQVIQKFSVKPDTIITEVVKDSYGNSMLKLRWSDLKSGTYDYSIETIIRSSRRPLQDIDLAANSRWLAGKITDRVRELAWFYREAETVSDAADIVKLAHSMLTYDADEHGRKIQEILQSGSGDAMSYSILLASLLRAAGIPSRIITGDAWLPNEEKISNHAWVEVLAIENGNEIWVPFDASSLRGGSINADYIIKSAGDGSSQERLEFIGAGNAEWYPNADRVDILDSKAAPMIEITAAEPAVTFPRNLSGWVGATLNPQGCGFWRIAPISCIDENKMPLLAFESAERTIWACNAKEALWFFRIRGGNYICPIRISESSGGSVLVNVTINNATPQRELSIAGLGSVHAGEVFDLLAIGIDPAREADMIFYSPTLDSISDKRAWTLPLKPGVYDFYLWFDGSFASKRVNAVEEREFTIALSSQETAAVDEPMPVSIVVTNLLSSSASAKIKMKANNIPAVLCLKEDGTTFCDIEHEIVLKSRETRSLDFTTTLTVPGANELTASAEHRSASFVSKDVEVVMPRLKQLERTLRAFSLAAGKILHFLAVIPRVTMGNLG